MLRDETQLQKEPPKNGESDRLFFFVQEFALYTQILQKSICEKDVLKTCLRNFVAGPKFCAKKPKVNDRMLGNEQCC